MRQPGAGQRGGLRSNASPTSTWRKMPMPSRGMLEAENDINNVISLFDAFFFQNSTLLK